MKEHTQKITLNSYLDLAQLLKRYQGTHEENRSFGLKHQEDSVSRLQKWKEKYLYKITDSLDSTSYLHYLTTFTYMVSFLFLLFGLITGFTLLSYSGKEPVNVIYLLLVMVGLPLLSILLTVLSMYTGNVGAKFFNHFSPLYYLEKIINFFYFSKKVDLSHFSLSSKLTKWIFLDRLQLFSFLFALGLLISLLLTVISKDIAFGWSSTLEIDSLVLQQTLAYLATPWQTFLPTAVPTVELVELSHYYRLGEKLESSMIQNADKLGAWWKFLAMAMLVYAIILRLLLWAWVHFAYKRLLKKEFLRIAGVEKLLWEFETPFVSTQAQTAETHLDVASSKSSAQSDLALAYNAILGWNYSEEDLHLIVDRFGVNAKVVKNVGGKNSFGEDQAVIAEVEKAILVYVKAWEPPTMDFVDFLEELLGKEEVIKVDICPLGTSTNGYESQARDLQVWFNKLEKVDSAKLGVIDV
ncbi:MAG TPA: DUF2868 domain-containing protein [Campylobacterales bacterium]|nr:DUF2868 domain-containing protein [Campylobacterales bacterium]HHS92199.1 DUF2868 domain-containing protein [Campylobacterales bacterium]